MVDVQDLKSCDPFGSCGFESRPRHRGVAQLVSAPRLGRGGPRFESEHPDTRISGYGSMVEQQISNLFMRVRFPLPAHKGIESRDARWKNILCERLKPKGASERSVGLPRISEVKFSNESSLEFTTAIPFSTNPFLKPIRFLIPRIFSGILFLSFS